MHIYLQMVLVISWQNCARTQLSCLYECGWHMTRLVTRQQQQQQQAPATLEGFLVMISLRILIISSCRPLCGACLILQLHAAF